MGSRVTIKDNLKLQLSGGQHFSDSEDEVDEKPGDKQAEKEKKEKRERKAL